MKTLAAFILRGPLQAIGVAVLSGLLAFVVPPLTIVTGGVVALVTLRNGAKAGLVVVAGTAGVLAGLAYASLSELAQLLTYLTSLVLAVIPVWGLAWVLRTTVSLGKTVYVAALMGVLLVTLMHLTLADPVEWWNQVLTLALQPAIESGQFGVEGLNVEQTIHAIAELMTGVMAAAMVISFLVALAIGRGLQGLLYNPGGFNREFNEIRLGTTLAGVSLAALVVALLLDNAMGKYANDLLWVFGAIYILPGIAVAHSWIAQMAKPTPWLIGFYLLLMFVPHVMVLLAFLGWSDSWVNIRGWIGRRKGSDRSGE